MTHHLPPLGLPEDRSPLRALRAFADRIGGRWERYVDTNVPSLPSPLLEPLHTQVHQLLNSSEPCQYCEPFDLVWSETLARVPKSFLDGSKNFAEVIWSATRHLAPATVVETGVAQGLSSAVCLAALEANTDNGRLWSIDLPPRPSRWKGTVGAAVDPHLYSRWTYCRGSARRLLPSILADLGTLDIFIHDGEHTYSNMMREFNTAWPYLKTPHGCLIADDALANSAFEDFTRLNTDNWLLVAGVGIAFRD